MKKANLSKEEMAALDEEVTYWKEIEKYIPEFKLYGWTYKQSASFITRGHYGEHHSDLINITGYQRDVMVKHFEDWEIEVATS